MYGGDCMFKIGEFSKLTQVSIRMLHYYDQKGLMKPAVIDAWTGYRMYSIEQIPVLSRIVYLRDSGFNVMEIASILNNDNQEFIINQLDKKYVEIIENIQVEQAKLEKITLAKKELFLEDNNMHYTISIKEVPSYYVLSLRKIIPNYYAEATLWLEFTTLVAELGIKISDYSFSIYHDKEYKEEDVDVELCVVPIIETKKDIDNHLFRYTEAVDMMACTMVYGDFSNIAGVYLSFARWLQENDQYEMYGPNRQIVHRGPWNEDNPNNYLTELQIPIKQKR